MKLSDFDYHLPPELIATEPAQKRDQSRLLVLNKKNGKIEHRHFFDLVDYLQPGDLLVANNSKVIPARLLGKKSTGPSALLGTGGKVEVFLSKPLSGSPQCTGREIEGTWECLIKGRVKAGTIISLSKKLQAEIVEVLGDGISLVKFNLTGAEFMKEVEKIGHIPLPPYIEHARLDNHEIATSASTPPRNDRNDRMDYQTVYAEDLKKGSVAAPTAGLHFTPELIKKLKAKGVKIEYLTLHVGLGTFLPVKTEKIEEHKIHSEWAEIPQKTWEAIIKAKRDGHRVIAVGTTSARTLEFFANFQFPISNSQTNSKSQFPNKFQTRNDEKIKLNTAERLPKLEIENWKLEIAKSADFAAWVDIFIYPPYKFQIVDALITNFHLPKSTLLMLVSALATKKNIDKAYQEAIKAKYRFYSYGDAMLIT